MNKHTMDLTAENDSLRKRLTEALLDAERAREERNREHVRLNAEWMAKCEEVRKDAERYRYLVERFTGYDFDWMSSGPDAADGKSCAVFDVGREFRGGRDITAAIDAALAKKEGA